MRFQPEPEPEKEQSGEQNQKDSKLIEFNNFDQLTEESAQELKGLREKMIFMMKHEQKVRPDTDPLLTYISFLQMQICDLQAQNQKFGQIFENMARAIDSKADRVTW